MIFTRNYTKRAQFHVTRPFNSRGRLECNLIYYLTNYPP